MNVSEPSLSLASIVLLLTGGVQYSLAVAAVDVSGPGPAVNVTVTVNGDLPLPLPPVSVAATAGDGVVTVTWSVVQEACTRNYSASSHVSSCAVVYPRGESSHADSS